MFSISICDQWKNLVEPVDPKNVINRAQMFFMPNNSLAEDFVRYSMKRGETATFVIAVEYGCAPGLAWCVDENRYKLAFRVIDENDAKEDLAVVHRNYNNWLDAFIAEAEAALATVSS